MKDFDEYLLDDLAFTVRGETFQMEYVQPEVMAEYEDSRAERLHQMREDAKANGDDIYIPNDAAETIEILDNRILSFLRPEDHDRWKALRARKDKAVPYVQLKEIERWMVEVQSVRPTETPSPSGPGRGSTGRSSTAQRPSREAASTA